MRDLPEGPDRRAETRRVMRWMLNVSACVVSCAWDFRRLYNAILLITILSREHPIKLNWVYDSLLVS